MQKFLPLAACAAALGLSAPALAGGYVSLGLAPGAELHGDLDDSFTSDGDPSAGRLAIGQRHGPIGLEAVLFGADLTDAQGDDYATVSLAVDLRFYIGLIGGLELYPHGGLNKTWLTSRDADAMFDAGYSGRGYQYGAGLQYSFSPMPVVSAAIWLDFTRQTLALREDARPDIDGEIDMLTVGLTLGR